LSTTTRTTTTTRTHTATWLADVILGTIADILADLGIDLTRLYRDWPQDESAVQAWVLEQSLSMVILECHQPNGSVSPIVEFPVTYRAGGEGDAQFTAHRAALARFRAKLERVPSGSAYTLFCTFSGPHSAQPGWGPGTRASTEGLTPLSANRIASAPDATASMKYWR
jgi:hypothetical protein